MEVVREIGSGGLYEVRSDQLGGAPDESACGEKSEPHPDHPRRRDMGGLDRSMAEC